MKTIRLQLKPSKMFVFSFSSIGGHYSIFIRLQKKTNRGNKGNKLKFIENMQEKAVEAVKPYFATQHMFN